MMKFVNRVMHTLRCEPSAAYLKNDKVICVDVLTTKKVMHTLIEITHLSNYFVLVKQGLCIPSVKFVEEKFE